MLRIINFADNAEGSQKAQIKLKGSVALYGVAVATSKEQHD